MLLKMTDEPDDYEGPWPEGDAMTEWVMVPREPTEQMLVALANTPCRVGWPAKAYRAMLDAAPAAPVQEQAQGEPVAEPALTIEVAQDADGAWSLTVPTYFPCMPVGKHDLYLHPPRADAKLARLQSIIDDSNAENAMLRAHVGRLRDALRWAIREVERNACTHEETHRAGAIWTICDSCSRKWADDEGGFEPYVEPQGLIDARRALEGGE